MTQTAIKVAVAQPAGATASTGGWMTEVLIMSTYLGSDSASAAT